MTNNVLIPLDELAAAFPGCAIEGVLKHGGQKNVFLANHSQYGRIALKVFSPETERERVYREIGIEQRRLPRVPKVFESVEKTFSTGDYFVAMEQLVDGEDLNSFCSKNGKIDRDFAIRLLRDVLEILIALEEERLVHRDIKPDNIILDRSGRFWLIDFGAARDLEAKTLTLTGWRAPLTYGYAAPEQYDSSMRDMIDIRTDLFSLGVTVYTLLKGRNPFAHPGMNGCEVMLTTQRYHATTLQIPNDANNGLAKFLKLLMNKDLGARPRTAKRALEWLGRFVGQET